jgi:formyl-CoA transferase
VDEADHGPLVGTRVLELSSFVFAPSAGRVLADLGADVIKIEPPSGDPLRGLENVMTALQQTGTQRESVFVELANRGKRSVALDLSSPKGRATLDRILPTVDVLLTNYLPSARRRLQIDVGDVREVNARLIYARASGWGPSGPMKAQPGFDMVSAWASSGLAFLLADESGEPPKMPFAIFDTQAGIELAGGIAIALYKREKTGIPSIVDVSLFGAGLWSVQIDVAQGTHANRASDRSNARNPLVNLYQTSDARWIYFGLIQSDPYWVELCGSLGASSLVEDIRFRSSDARESNNVELILELDRRFASRDFAFWRTALASFSGGWAPVLSPLEARDHPQASPNGLVADHVTNSGHRVDLIASPLQFDEVAATAGGPAPEHGQHTEEVLLEVGLSWEEIAELNVDGAIGPRG